MGYKAALITGSADRLGRAMALSLAADGVAIAVHYASGKEKAEDTVDAIEAIGGKAIALQADLLDRDATADLVNRACDGLEQNLDVLINNASIFEYDTISSATTESWDRHMQSNLEAPFVLTQKFAAQAPKATGVIGKKTAHASIINMVDQRVRKYTPEFMTYSLAKNALWVLTQTSAQALAPNIRVNAIGPGTTLQGLRQSKEHFEGQRKASLLQRGADTEDIVRTMQYFLTSPAVTGQLICVDGGQHLGWQTPDIQGIE